MAAGRGQGLPLSPLPGPGEVRGHSRPDRSEGSGKESGEAGRALPSAAAARLRQRRGEPWVGGGSGVAAAALVAAG